MAKVSREAGLTPSTLANTLTHPLLKGEGLMVIRLDVPPSEILPGRYPIQEINVTPENRFAS